MSESTFKRHSKLFLKSGGIGGLMNIDDIEYQDMARIVAEVFSLFKLNNDMDKSYIKVLSKYGIVCPHPSEKRLYSGTTRSKKPLVVHRWYDCEMCDCSVFNEHWMKAVREEEEKQAKDTGK